MFVRIVYKYPSVSIRSIIPWTTFINLKLYAILEKYIALLKTILIFFFFHNAPSIKYIKKYINYVKSVKYIYYAKYIKHVKYINCAKYVKYIKFIKYIKHVKYINFAKYVKYIKFITSNKFSITSIKYVSTLNMFTT